MKRISISDLDDVVVEKMHSVSSEHNSEATKNNLGDESSPNPDSNYIILEQPMGSIKPVRVICIGAGASGINMAYQVSKYLKNVTLIVYEKNPDIGGTWYENRYPGCKCDVPSHNYQFTWERNPEWSSVFSGRAEILSYLKNCVDKHKLGEYIRLNSQIVGAKWDDDKGIWDVQVKNVSNGVIVDDWCDFLLNAGGLLNQWKWPDIPGLQSFGGTLVHSANWPDNLNLSDKKVAVIGNGSSGLQIIPAIQPQVKELVHPIRTPTWVTAGADSRYRTLREKKISNMFSEEQKRDFRSNPEEYMDFIKQVEREGNAKFRMMVNGSEGAKKAERDIRQSMLDALGARAKDLGPKMVPNFAVGCRRITPGVGYLESFSESNVQVFVGVGVEGVDETGISLTTGEHIEVDVMICSTGFDVTFNPRFPIVGRNGVNLADRWGSLNIPRAYLSLAIPDFPNYFVFLGPNAPSSHGSVFTITEQISKYILQIITKAQVEMIKSVEVKQEAVDDFTEHIDAFMPRTAWASTCRSWFKRGKESGPITAVHPGSRIHWFHTMERPKFEDFNYTYLSKNRFRYLANGFSVREEGGDDTWYLDQPSPRYLYY